MVSLILQINTYGQSKGDLINGIYKKKLLRKRKQKKLLTNQLTLKQPKMLKKKQRKRLLKKKKRVFKDSDPILCMSITPGQLGMFGLKTNIHYSWVARGDETEVEYQDLVAAIRSGKKHITEPYFIIKDDDFLEAFPNVKKLYGDMYSIKDLRSVITDLDANSMKLTINSLPSGAKESIKNIVSSMIMNGQIDSVSKIKTLDEIYDTKFMTMTELYGD